MGKCLFFHDKKLFVFGIRSGGLGKFTFSTDPERDTIKAISRFTATMAVITGKPNAF